MIKRGKTEMQMSKLKVKIIMCKRRNAVWYRESSLMTILMNSLEKNLLYQQLFEILKIVL